MFVLIVLIGNRSRDVFKRVCDAGVWIHLADTLRKLHSARRPNLVGCTASVQA
jgi:hypothetical protein